METTITKSERRRAHLPVPEEVDVAIVGSGLGGLVAAAYLARRGLRVSVFEAHYVAGGCATQFTRGGKRNRYRFDVGLHYIGDCGEDGTIPRILRDLGITLEYEELDPDGFDTLVFPDFRFRIPADVDQYRQRLVDLFPHERRGIERYVKILRGVMLATRLMEKGPSWRSALPLLPYALALYQNQRRTMKETLDSCVRDPRLRAVFLGQSGDYGLPPSEVSAMLHLGLAGHYFRGAYYPKGGGQVIADRIAESVEKAGGQIHLRRPVQKILVEDGRVRGLRLEPRAGEPARDVRARMVLSNADLRMTLERLVGPEHLPASWVARAKQMKMGGAIFMTFLGIKADLGALGMKKTNYWQFDDYDVEALYQDARRDGPIRGGACYVTSASLKEPGGDHAPAGVSNVEVMTLVPGEARRWGVTHEDAEAWSYRETALYQETKARLEEEMIARLEKMFPGSASAIVFRESATPVTHTRFTRATDGTGYGLAASPEQFMDKRPGYRGPIEGLYFTGASTRAGHGIVGAMMGGEKAAQRVLQGVERTLSVR
jgi:phytoene dehydrogenase-like protein